MKSFTADFETTTDIKDCRVWAYALCEIGNTDNFIYGNNMEDFMKFCSNKKENYKLLFHNLKFDGEYIFSYLLNNGYEVIEDKKERRDKTFTCLIMLSCHPRRLTLPKRCINASKGAGSEYKTS